MFVPPIEHSIGSNRGAATSVAIGISGIRAASTILAVITRGVTGGAPTGRDPAAFTAAAGSISSGSIDTTNMFVLCVWV
jgi:hypothetical protein